MLGTLTDVNAPSDVGAIREAQRLEAVRRLRIIDTEPEQAFDDIVSLATQICRMPIGFVGFFESGIDMGAQGWNARVALV